MAIDRLEIDHIVGGICIFVLAGVLTAGLWPFHAPGNQAVWLRKGLLLGRHGTALSAAAFTTSGPPDEAGRSVEIWLQPAHAEDSGAILAFYNPGERQQFSLHQSEDDLALQTDLKSARWPHDAARLAYLPRIFRHRARLFITLTSGTQGTAAYVDGADEAVPEFPARQPSVHWTAGSRHLSGSE